MAKRSPSVSKQGPIPLDEALRLAHQIIDGMEAAHEKGITHRDLKPANIKIKPDGSIKILDFVLAKTASTPASSVVPSENSPTLTMGMTEAAMILGTAAYMAPEQAKGKVVDKRPDIWAFGVVLYEMLTTERLFEGEDVGETLAAVIKERPDFSRAPQRVQRSSTGLREDGRLLGSYPN
jgi:serine/threonine-protein kinase